MGYGLIIRKVTAMAVITMVALTITAGTTALAAENAPLEQGQPADNPHFKGIINIKQGSQIDLPVKLLKRYLIGAPNVVCATESESKLLLTGKQAGTTVLVVWEESGQSTYQVCVTGEDNNTQNAVIKEPTVFDPVAIDLQPGESHLLSGKNITRTSVSTPEIVNIVPVSTTQILLNAVKDGLATVRVWDDKGVSTYTVTVARKAAPAEELVALVSQQIGVQTIKASLTGDTVVLDGTAPSLEASKRAEHIAGTCGKKVLNLITIESNSPEKVIESLKSALQFPCLKYNILPDQTILINGAVATEEEVARIQMVVQAWVGTPEQNPDKNSVNTNIDFIGQPVVLPDVTDRNITEARQVRDVDGTAVVSEAYNITQHVFGGRIVNGPRIVATIDVNPSLSRQVLVNAQIIEVNRSKLKTLGIQWQEIFGDNATNPLIILENRPSPVPLGDLGPFARTTLQATLKALVTENAARILSEPRLLITDGHVANILVGGELPIPVAQNVNIGSTSISVIFKPFGIQLTVRPRITSDNRILMTLTPEVSDPDFTNAVVAAGIKIPSLIVRRATTTVYISDGQSLAIGGLLSSRNTKIINKVPLLSQIPIIGDFFKNENSRREETDLIILVTPHIVEKNEAIPLAPPHK